MGRPLAVRWGAHELPELHAGVLTSVRVELENAGDTPCEIIEIISPAGFEDCFREMAEIWPDLSKAGPILEKYQLEMDPDSVPRLCERFGLTFGQAPKIDG